MQPQAQPGMPQAMPASPLAMPAAVHAAAGGGDGALFAHAATAYHRENDGDDAGRD